MSFTQFRIRKEHLSHVTIRSEYNKMEVNVQVKINLQERAGYLGQSNMAISCHGAQHQMTHAKPHALACSIISRIVRHAFNVPYILSATMMKYNTVTGVKVQTKIRKRRVIIVVKCEGGNVRTL